MPSQNLLQLAGVVFASGLIFVAVSALLFWPLEELLEGDKAARPTLKDLAYLWFYQSYGLWIGAGIVFELAFLLRGLMPQSLLLFVKGQPFWLQVTAALLMAEIWVYLVHRLAHKWKFLWQFHRVHHTVVDMTWSASSRQHPVDFLLIIVGANLPAMILGIDLRSIALFVILERLYTVLLHSNLRLDWGWFSKVVASPSLHRRHHDPSCRGKNYAGILSLLDVIGKTYESPDGVGR
ncbi:MAG TPA: sterol desaturase family protein [Fimbriimonadaceae bacterium]|jgi:sterol desaturase/sphingolipid hydroxylase (fatty acid hydroxylase superfamily)